MIYPAEKPNPVDRYDSSKVRRNHKWCDPEEIDELREHIRTGRPYGDEMFIAAAERATGQVLRKKQPGRRSRRVK